MLHTIDAKCQRGVSCDYTVYCVAFIYQQTMLCWLQRVLERKVVVVHREPVADLECF